MSDGPSMPDPTSTPPPARPNAAPDAPAPGSTAPGATQPAPGLDWRRLHLWQIQPVRDVLVIAAVFGLVYLGEALRVVTVPMLIALALAYLFEPIVRRLTSSGKMRREVCALLIIVLAAVLIVTPVTIGAGFAVMQGVGYAQEVARNTETLVRSLDKPEAANELPGPGWKKLREFLVDERDKAREYESWRESQRGTSNGTSNGAESGTDPTSPAPETRKPQPVKPHAAADDRASGAAKTTDAADTAKSATTEPEAKIDAAAGDTDAAADATVLVPPPEPSLTYRTVTWAIDWLQTNAQALGQRAIAGGAGAVAALLRTATWLGKISFTGFLTAFFFFFFCTGYGRVLTFAQRLVPKAGKTRVLDLLGKMDKVIAAFIRGRLTICFIQMIVFTIAFTIIGVPAALILGPVVGLLTLLPYVAGLAVPLVILLMWLDPPTGFRGLWWWIVFAPIMAQVFSQLIDDYVLTPRIQGKATGMDTPTILFASIAGATLAGMYGLLLAIPVAACIKILLQEVFWPRFRAWAEGRARDFLPLEEG
jgi:predicted PurR-regulated permease PerM